MRRVIVILGVVLMVLAFVILTLFIIAPAVISPLDNAPFLKGILQTMLCQPNERLTASYSTYNTPTSSTRSTDLTCVDSRGNEREVSGQIIGIGMVGYLVPFLSGLFMSMLGASAGKKTQVYVPSTTRSSKYNPNAERLEALVEAQMKSNGGSNGGQTGQTYFPAHDFGEHRPLTQRLQELKDAYNAGLVTEAEYNEKRKELLNES